MRSSLDLSLIHICGKSQHDLARTIAAVAARAGETHQRPVAEPPELPLTERDVRGQHRDDGAFILVGRDVCLQQLLEAHIPPHEDKGSIITVLATDIPLSERQLRRLCHRALVGLSRTGSYCGNGSGEIVLAFTTDVYKRQVQRGPHRGYRTGTGSNLISQKE